MQTESSKGYVAQGTELVNMGPENESLRRMARKLPPVASLRGMIFDALRTSQAV